MPRQVFFCVGSQRATPAEVALEYPCRSLAQQAREPSVFFSFHFILDSSCILFFFFVSSLFFGLLHPPLITIVGVVVRTLLYPLPRASRQGGPEVALGSPGRQAGEEEGSGLPIASHFEPDM